MKAEDIYDKALTEYPIKEKLNKKAVGTYDANYPRRKAFIIGAEWMQEKMIEKVAKWLRKNIDEDVSIPCGNVIKIISADEFVEYFTKSMEEEK